MKDKLVIWGENEKDEKVMMGIHLLPDSNKIEIFIFPEAIVTETFEKAMMNEWRKGTELDFPEDHSKIERELSASESLLPDNLKTKETDLINRAKSEWLFVVLSQKLSQEFRNELDGLKEKIDHLSEYNAGAWNELKDFWGKVQKQMKEKTLIWQHTKELKDTTNGLFDKMKELRTRLEGELQEKSVVYKAEFTEALNDIQQKINNDARLKPLFDDLKNLQKKFWDTKFISKHRNELKKHFDKAFKEIKEKRFGGESTGAGPVERLIKRLDGLDNAIHRMESSIRRDKKELEFQQHRIDTTDGQLEAQIRQAKINVVQERVNSKTHKLEDMLKTKVELEDRLQKTKERAAKQAEEAQRKAELAKAKNAAKEKIAAQIKEKDASISDEEAQKLEQAAKELTQPKKEAPKAEETKAEEAKPKEETKSDGSILGAVSGMVGDAMEDIVDSVKAVAEVLEDKVEDFIADMKSDEEE
ncbi:MAG TPA: hypothetical protein ENK85_12860 [Saprospiraceae bacterium]|nr:hypothetical protein [Saprospiraceae bacterium]